MRLVDDARRCWRWISMQCMGAALALQGAWEAIPPDLKAGFSDKHVRWVTGALLLLGIFGRLVKQSKDAP